MPPMSSPARRVAAIAVLLLSLAIGAVLGLRGMGFQIGFGPFASATPAVATATPEPSGPPPSQDLLTAFGQIAAQVRDLRGLPAADIGSPQILTRAELTEELAALFEKNLPPAERDAENATLRALGLLTTDQDLVELLQNLLTDQVLGFYEFDRKRIVVATDAGLTATARMTYAHEYTHALQDAAFDSAAAHDALNGKDDAEAARVALEEGDASIAGVLWGIGHLTAEELLDIQQTPIPDTFGVPAWMVRQLDFPYLAGVEFVSQLYASGGWDAVDAAYADPPSSTEQVLHPTKYIDDEAPLPVNPLDLWSAVGSDWAQASDTTMGEEWMAIWLEGIGVDPKVASMAAAGWGGDRLTVANATDGRLVLGWRIAWDAPIEATEFETAYAGVQSRLPFAARVIHVSDRETIVLQASSAALLDAIATLVAG